MSVYEPRRYTVDLSEPSEKRWDTMLEDPWVTKTARKLGNSAFKMVEEYNPGNLFGPIAGKIGAWTLKKLAATVFNFDRDNKQGYDKDIDIWDEYCYGDRDLVIMNNLSYELSMLCSSVAFWSPKLGMVHARNMDWPLRDIKKGTILVDFINAPAGNFTSVSVPGLLGVLSGVAKGRFSATINQAKRGGRLNKDFLGGSAPMLLRFVFEHCQTFEDAVETLRSNKCFAPVFFHVTGCKKGESAIIWAQPKHRNKVYKYKDNEPLAVTNHEDNFSRPKYLGEECDEEGYDSCTRLETIIEAARTCKATSLKGISAILRKEPVWNGNTMQSMVFQPKIGEAYLQEC